MNHTLIQSLQKNHPNVTVIMASKYIDAADMTRYYDAGIHNFGENRVDALKAKQAALDLPITWHFIGTLQSKKVKTIINDIDVLHTVDRMKLMTTIQNTRHTPLDAFIQFNISNEASKHGFAVTDIDIISDALKAAPIIHPIGVMGMAEHSSDETVIQAQFEALIHARDALHKTHPSITKLSMGMSDDYALALQCGATHLRLGRILLEDSHV